MRREPWCAGAATAVQGQEKLVADFVLALQKRHRWQVRFD